MKHTMVLGIEHLMTGISLTQDNNGRGFQFVRESSSMVRVESDAPFEAYWPNRSHIASTPSKDEFDTYFAGDGEIEWYAQCVAPAMAAIDYRSYQMQIAERRGSPKLAPGEPTFPKAVVDAMRRKHGKDANIFLGKLLWNGDHWYYTHDGMYIGVEPDGYIHT